MAQRLALRVEQVQRAPGETQLDAIATRLHVLARLAHRELLELRSRAIQVGLAAELFGELDHGLAIGGTGEYELAMFWPDSNGQGVPWGNASDRAVEHDGVALTEPEFGAAGIDRDHLGRDRVNLRRTDEGGDEQIVWP